MGMERVSYSCSTISWRAPSSTRSTYQAPGAAVADAKHLRGMAAEQVRGRGYDIGAVAAELAEFYGQALLRHAPGSPEARRIV